MAGIKYISTGMEPMSSLISGLETMGCVTTSSRSNVNRTRPIFTTQTERQLSGGVFRGLLCASVFFVSSGAIAQEAGDAEKGDGEIIVVEKIEDGQDEKENADKSDELQSRFYVGIGVGASDLDPDTSGVSGVTVTDSSQTGTQITIGADINKLLSVELHGADLGSAELSNGGEISYKEYGLSGLFYIGDKRGNYNRNGFTLFGRAGIGTLSNDSTAGVNFDKQEGVHVILGAGAEYAMRNGLAARFEGMAFDTDASYLQLGLLYRFGSASSLGMPSIKWPFGGLGAITGAFGRKDGGFKMAKPLPGDLDGDGVGDADDECEKSPAGQPIDDAGCPIFDGVIEGLNFFSGSAELTDGAKEILDEMAEALLAYPDLRIRVAAHTDSLGDDQENMLLSRRRALSVSKHLVAAGVSKFRLEAVSYGETQPIATNKTREGRSSNRRVELIAVP